MKPLFPVLFLLTMLGMMPKVMPAMLEAVGSLMLHLLPEVMPLIAQPLAATVGKAEGTTGS